jgi:hypothetical protein
MGTGRGTGGVGVFSGPYSQISYLCWIIPGGIPVFCQHSPHFQPTTKISPPKTPIPHLARGSLPSCAAVQRTKPATGLNPNPKSKDTAVSKQTVAAAH